MEIEVERFAVPKAGDFVRVTLVATKSDRATRMRNGVTLDTYEGTAVNTLTEGERFFIRIGLEETFISSPVVRVGKGLFTTENSSYSFEVLEEQTHTTSGTPAKEER